MSEITLLIPGLDKLLVGVDKLPDEVKKEIGLEIQASGLNIKRTMDALAPVNIGALKSHNQYLKVDDLTCAIFNDSKYAAYNEFGTGADVFIPPTPPEAESLAALARGRGIRRSNKVPHAFFFPAVNQEAPLLVQRVKDILEESGKILT